MTENYDLTKNKEDFENNTSRRKVLNKGLIFAVLASTLGSGFQHGYNTGVINAPQALIENWISKVALNRTNDDWEEQVTWIWSTIVSVFCVGGLIGACFTRIIATTFGRKRGLLLNNILVFPAAMLEGFAKTAKSFEMLFVGRFLIGVNAGLNAGLTPMYISEISPVKFRGAVGTVYQLCISSSILLSQILGLETILGTEELWPYLFGCTIIPAILQIIALPFCSESPRFLFVEKDKDAIAKRELERLRSTPEEVESEMEELHSEREYFKTAPKVTLKEMFTNPVLRMPLMISIVLMIGQQFSGINAVLYFSTSIFSLSNLSNRESQYGTIGVGAMIVLMTIVTLFLIDKAGRKTLLMIGFGGMSVVTVLLTTSIYLAKENIEASYTSIFLIIIFVALFAIGPGSIPWLIVPELFNQSARALAISVSVAINWAANFIVGIGFLPLQGIMGSFVFAIFIVLLALFFIFTWKKVPETKNKKVEEITAMFRQMSYQ